MTSLFTEDAHFYDETPTKVGMEPIDLQAEKIYKTFFSRYWQMAGSM